MIVNSTFCNFFSYYQHKGHCYGQCYTRPDIGFMYVNIPKNASSWTKPNLLSFGFEIYNYHIDHNLINEKMPMVVLRDPIERWISGISEYMVLYHPTYSPDFINDFTLELIFDKIAFDDHTESQVYFLEGLNSISSLYFKCDSNYRKNFAHYLNSKGFSNNYDRFELQHVTAQSPQRTMWAKYFKTVLDENPKYLDKLKQYYHNDYDLINTVKFYEINNEPR